MICPDCETENPSGARFCLNCGHSFQQPCPQCGTELPTAARFCFSCGFEIEAGATDDAPGRPAREVAEEIQATVASLASSRGERRTITMLFCDVQGSTAAAEVLDPEAWSSLMHRAFDRFIAPVERYEGTVARLLGDAILAYFGAPIAHEDDPERAVLAAIDIREASRELAVELLAQHGIEFGIRIGINTGLVIVGDVGSDLFSEYAALGDAANLAARMEQTADPNTIRIAEATHRLIAPMFETTSVGPVEVKGKQEPVDAFEVVGRKQRRGRVRGLEGIESPLVGRDTERATLEEVVAEVAQGRGRIVSIMGEAGLGKTRLASELRDSPAAADLRWLEGRAFSYDVTRPYGPFIGLLTSVCGIEALAPEERYQSIKGQATDLLGPEGAPHAVYLAKLMGVEPEGEDLDLLSYLDPPILKSRTVAAIGAFVGGLAEAQPTVLVMEDLHWADPTSIDVVNALLAVPDRVPLLLLLLFRPRRDEPSWAVHETAGRDCPHRYVQVPLSRLSGDASRELIANLLEVEGLSMKVRSLILDKAEGNPFFVEEVIRSLLDQGVIVRGETGFISTRDVETLDVPDSLAAVLTTRLDQLPADAKRVLQTAAVLGREFDYQTLAAVTDGGVDLEEVVRDLQRRELIVESGGRDQEFAFKHALTRDTAYGALLSGVRRDLHGLVGTLLEERQPDRVTDLAHHFSLAEERSAAFPYLVAAGDLELGAFAVGPAAAHYRTALEFFDVGDDATLAGRAYEGLGQALAFGGEVAEALTVYDEMLEFGRDRDLPPIQVSALNKKAMTKTIMMGDLAGAEEDLLTARAIGESVGDQAGIAEFHVVYCVVNTGQGKLETAAAHLEDAARIGEAVHSPFHKNFGLSHHANTLMLLGRYDEAGEASAEAERQSRADGDRLHVAVTVGNTQAFVAMRNGKVVDGMEKARWAAEELFTIGAVFDEPYVRWTAAFIAIQLGRWEEVLEHASSLVGFGGAFGQTGMTAAGAAMTATARRAVFGPGDAEAAALAERAREQFDLSGGQWFAPISLALLAHQALAARRVDEASECVARSHGYESPSTLIAEPELLMCSASVALDRGHIETAKGQLNEVTQLIADQGLQYLKPRLGLLSAMVASTEDNTDAVADLIQRGLEDAKAMSLLPDIADLGTYGASILSAAGREEAAIEFRDAAADAFAEMASLIADPEMRRAYLRTYAVTG